MYSFLGWANVIIVTWQILPFLLLRLNKHFIKTKSVSFRTVIKILRMFHKPLGIVLLLSAAVHGYLALRSLRLHTGTVLFGLLLITTILGGTFFRIKKKQVLVWHRLFAGLMILMLLIHVYFPSAFS